MTPCCPSEPSTPPRVLRVGVYAGPTGGHLFPAQSFAEVFRKRFPASRIELVTSRRAEKLTAQMPEGSFDAVHFLPDFGFPVRLSFSTLKPFFLAPYLFLKSWLYLKKTTPDICVGFASFVSYPGMMTAHWLGVPTIIHEQNVIPGKATQWLAPHMDVAAESFEGTKFGARTKQVRNVGLPLRSIITQALAPKPRVGSPCMTLLVVGGSQGAKGLNVAVVDAMERLSDEERAKIAVIHITGAHDQAWVSEQYQKIKLNAEVLPFSRSMNELFQRADLAITRAGANTLFELAFFGVPAFVIPYPHAGGHQKYNAQSFAAKGGVMYHEEDASAGAWLTEQMRIFWSDAAKREAMTQSMKILARPNAAEELVDLAQRLILGHENH